MNNRTDIRDLRTAIEVLKEQSGQYAETDVEVNPAAELSGVYRYVGAGGTVKRPTTIDGAGCNRWTGALPGGCSSGSRP